MTDKARITVAEAMARIPGPDGERYVEMFSHGTLEIEMYAPRGNDPQQPHDRDEVYVVVEGHGEFIYGESRTHFAKGDVLFVAAEVEHRFVDFSDDFAAWVVFYGPRGGEAET